jgi:hypothetical protein
MLTKNPDVLSVAEPADAAKKLRRRRGRPKATRLRNNPLWWAHFYFTVNLARASHRGIKRPTKTQLAKLLKASPWREHRAVTVGWLRQHLSHPGYVDLPPEERFKFVTQMVHYWMAMLGVAIDIQIKLNPRVKAKVDQDPSLRVKGHQQIAEIAGNMTLAAWDALQMDRKAQGKPPLPVSYLEQEVKKAAQLPPDSEFKF